MTDTGPAGLLASAPVSQAAFDAVERDPDLAAMIAASNASADTSKLPRLSEFIAKVRARADPSTTRSDK
jgi:hypothetical protein